MSSPQSRFQRSAVNSLRAALALILLALAGCASVSIGANGPAQTAQSYVGEPFIDLEAQLGPPDRENLINGGERLSTWEFDRCSVTSRTNADGIVEDVHWSRGCAAI
jgi:hypothetical protein